MAGRLAQSFHCLAAEGMKLWKSNACESLYTHCVAVDSASILKIQFDRFLLACMMSMV